MSDDEAEDTISRGLDAGSANPRGPGDLIKSRQEALDYLEAVSELFARIPRKGHRGSRMRVGMEAMIDIARVQGGPGNIITTIHEVSIFAGSGRNSIGTALGELKDEGWLHLRRRGYQGVPSHWDIRVPTACQDDLRDLLESGSSCHAMCISRDEAIHGQRYAYSNTTNRHDRIPVGHDVFLSPLTSMTEDGLISKAQGLGKSACATLALP